VLSVTPFDMIKVDEVIMNNEARGYKPHLVRDILGLTKERFRYWRNKLDPKPYRPYFSYSDILAYRVMKALIEYKHLPVEFLSKFDWSELFKLLSHTNNRDLERMVVTLHVEQVSMTIQHLEEIADKHSNKLIFVFLKELIEEQLNAFLELGAPNNNVSNIQAFKNNAI